MTTNVTQLTVDVAMIAPGLGSPNELANARRPAVVTAPCVEVPSW